PLQTQQSYCCCLSRENNLARKNTSPQSRTVSQPTSSQNTDDTHLSAVALRSSSDGVPTDDALSLAVPDCICLRPPQKGMNTWPAFVRMRPTRRLRLLSGGQPTFRASSKAVIHFLLVCRPRMYKTLQSLLLCFLIYPWLVFLSQGTEKWK
ncbi:unnamed protein product, partial [Ectocarpus fasciculatus]